MTPLLYTSKCQINQGKEADMDKDFNFFNPGKIQASDYNIEIDDILDSSGLRIVGKQAKIVVNGEFLGTVVCHNFALGQQNRWHAYRGTGRTGNRVGSSKGYARTENAINQLIKS